MKDVNSSMEQVANFAPSYREEYMREVSEKTGYRERLRFFFERVFASARAETTSKNYREATEKVLFEKRPILSGDKEDGLESNHEKLRTELEDAGVGNHRDRQMVLDILSLLRKLETHDYDIIDYTSSRIKAGKTDQMYDELVEIYNIGPKKATLYLRDVVSSCGLEEDISKDQYRYVMPVDTWVHQIGAKLGIISTDSPNWVRNSKSLVNACPETVSPIDFNQGAWYIGANSFDVLMQNLYQIRSE